MISSVVLQEVLACYRTPVRVTGPSAPGSITSLIFFPPVAGMASDDAGDYERFASLSPAVRASLEVVDAALRLFGPERLVVSFNGGKDATALLHLACACYARAGLGPPRCVYWHEALVFPEVEAFVNATEARLGLPLLRYSSGFVDGLRDAVTARGVAAVLLGTRRGDPDGARASAWQPSSADYPAFMRVLPLLPWSYHDVWHFLTLFRLPYCSLYDRGYSSLGNTANTRPNPALARPGGGFGAACELASGALERGGRSPAGSPPPQPLPICTLALTARLPPAVLGELAAAVRQRVHESGGELLSLTAEVEEEGAAGGEPAARRPMLSLAPLPDEGQPAPQRARATPGAA